MRLLCVPFEEDEREDAGYLKYPQCAVSCRRAAQVYGMRLRIERGSFVLRGGDGSMPFVAKHVLNRYVRRTPRLRLLQPLTLLALFSQFLPNNS